MLLRIVYTVPLALLFMVMSDQWNPGGLIVGLIAGFAIMLVVGDLPRVERWQRLPQQFLWFVVYVVRLAWEITLSALDVTRRVLDPRLPISPGELDLSLNVREDETLLAALSAHAISVTPGELVTDFEVVDGQIHLVIHSLDVEDSRQKLDTDQAERVMLLNRILGKDGSNA